MANAAATAEPIQDGGHAHAHTALLVLCHTQRRCAPFSGVPTRPRQHADCGLCSPRSPSPTGTALAAAVTATARLRGGGLLRVEDGDSDGNTGDISHHEAASTGSSG